MTRNERSQLGRYIYRISMVLILLLSYTVTQAQEQPAERLEWFNEARFGMFIHWGPSVGRGMWAQHTARIPSKDDLRYDFWRRNLIILTAGELKNELQQEGFNFAFEIESVTEDNGLLIVATKDDHGLVVDEHKVTELYRPKRTFTGETSFVIHTNQ